MADFAEVPITNDPEYADLVPICQDDGPNPIVAIRYSKTFSDVHNYFRAVIHKNEISKRALKLTEKVINLNAANYTAWQFRRECIFKLEYDLFKELEFSEQIAHNSPKNYQLWWHRRIIIEAINKTDDGHKKYDLRLEKALIRDILKTDAKNYHAWSHYHWLLRSYKLYDDELAYLNKKLLFSDVRNNSAWNHRHFVIKETNGFNDITVLQSEIAFCRKKIERLATNHSVWYYYTQIVMQYLKKICESWMKEREEQMKWIRKVLDTQPYAPRAILFYIDLLTDKTSVNINGKDLIEAKTLLQLLATKVDRIRHNYYYYLMKGIEQQIQQMQTDNVDDMGLKKNIKSSTNKPN